MEKRGGGRFRGAGESVLRNHPVLINVEQGISAVQTRSIIGGENRRRTARAICYESEGRSAKPREWRRTDAINSSVSLYHEPRLVLIKKRTGRERERTLMSRREKTAKCRDRDIAV